MRGLHLDVSITVERKKLIDAIKAQREEHAQHYKEAKEGWQSQLMTLAREIMSKGPRLKKYPRALRRLDHPPECHIEEFDNALKMFEMTEQDSIELTAGDYAQLVLGHWDWRNEWYASNSGYMSSSRSTITPNTIRDDELD